MDTSIFDSVQGYPAQVGKNGDLHVSVSGTVDVDIASASATVSTKPASASSVAQGQVDVTTTSGGIQIIAAGSRSGLLIANLDAAITVYLGLDTSPTTTSGFPLAPGETFSLPAGVSSSAEVKGITSSGTARVAYLEFT